MRPRRADRATAMTRVALQILWPAFLMAGVLEILVFALVDPTDLHWLGGAPIEASRQAVYTLAFLAFWLVIAAAGAITALLLHRTDES
jgi:hypothetical protein